MKAGAHNSLKLTAASTLIAVALVIMGRLIVRLNAPPAPVSLEGHNERGRADPSVTNNASIPKALDPTLRGDWLELSEGTEYEGTGREIFRTEMPRKPPRPGPKPSPPAPPKTSSQPTMRLRFFGFASTPSEAKKIFLADDDHVFIGKEGDIVQHRYKILQISPTSVIMEDLIDDFQQTLPLDQG